MVSAEQSFSVVLERILVSSYSFLRNLAKVSPNRREAWGWSPASDRDKLFYICCQLRQRSFIPRAHKKCSRAAIFTSEVEKTASKRQLNLAKFPTEEILRSSKSFSSQALTLLPVIIWRQLLLFKVLWGHAFIVFSGQPWGEVRKEAEILM